MNHVRVRLSTRVTLALAQARLIHVFSHNLPGVTFTITFSLSHRWLMGRINEVARVLIPHFIIYVNVHIDVYIHVDFDFSFLFILLRDRILTLILLREVIVLTFRLRSGSTWLDRFELLGCIHCFLVLYGLLAPEGFLGVERLIKPMILNVVIGALSKLLSLD